MENLKAFIMKNLVTFQKKKKDLASLFHVIYSRQSIISLLKNSFGRKKIFNDFLITIENIPIPTIIKSRNYSVNVSHLLTSLNISIHIDAH